MAAIASQGRYEGVAAAELAVRWARPLVVAMTRTTSTLDVAHELARDGAPFGSVILADAQTAGRGRGGKRWHSEPGDGVWLTTIDRPHDAAALDVLSLRVGVAAAIALQPYAEAPITIKWPNDLLAAGAKLSGILVEARWREGIPEWVAIGIGVNVRVPSTMAAAGMRPGTTRLEVLDALLPALAGAAAATGALTPDEIAALSQRDGARGRLVVSPVEGRAEGVSASGELLVRSADEVLHRCRTGSLVFTEEG